MIDIIVILYYDEKEIGNRLHIGTNKETHDYDKRSS